MSPTEYPPQSKGVELFILDTTPLGSLFTLFLHCPIKAFAFICDLTQSSTETWPQALTHLEETEKMIVTMFEESEDLGTIT
jgi:Protein SCAI